MSSSRTLAYYNTDAPTTLVADASPQGLGCVLFQVQDGLSKVVAYGHHRLTDVESRYSQLEREALALIWACEYFQMYLLGKEFTLVSDNKPLVSIFSNPQSKPTPRLERWSLRLQAFNFKLQHRPGSSNIADPMSRLSIPVEPSVDPVTDDSYILSVIDQALPCAMSWSTIQEAAKTCEETKLISQALLTGNWQSYPAAIKALRNEFSSCDGVILRGTKIVIPYSLRQDVLSLAHEGHQGIVKTKQRLRLKVWWPGIDKEAEILCRSCRSCQLVSSSDAPSPVTPTKMPSGPWKFVSIDLLGPLPDGRSLVVLVDYFSRWFEWISTTPLWPQANGEVKRMNRTLLKVLKIAKVEHRDLNLALRDFAMAYRSTPHTGTGMTPYALMFGREMRTKIPMISDVLSKGTQEAIDREVSYKQSMKEYADQGTKDSNIQRGDMVVMRQEKRGKLDTNFGPEEHRVVDVQGSEIICSSPDGGLTRRNISFAKKLVESPKPSVSEESGSNGSFEKGTSPTSDPTQVVVPPRCPRERRKPIRFKDYDLS